MLAPLEIAVQMSERLLKTLQNPKKIEVAQLAMIACKQVLFYAYDQLDQKQALDGGFTPSYERDSVSETITQAVKLISLSSLDQTRTIQYDVSRIKHHYPVL